MGLAPPPERSTCAHAEEEARIIMKVSSSMQRDRNINGEINNWQLANSN
jgi:hypothetical protein